MAKRLFDIVMSALGLAALSPVLLITAFVVWFDTPGPVMYRQARVGRHGRVFHIHKFRSMHVQQPSGALQVTADDDPRITRSGRIIRKWKLDELPQLIDVFLGRMSLVGPRPEVPRYVASYPPELREVVLSVRPGITDPASIRFRDENALLAGEPDRDLAYIEKVLPEKLRLQAEYVRERSFMADIRIIFQTLRAVVA